MNSEQQKKVAVIGAGPMGLATAYELAKQGIDVTLYEKSATLGGMTASFDFAGLSIERFYHFHCTSDLDFFELLQEIGLEDKLKWKQTKMCYWFDHRLQYWGNPVALLRFKGISLMAKFRYGLHAFLSVKRDTAGALDSKNAKLWIQQWVGDEAWKKLWENLFTLKFYQYSDNLSAAWIWSRIRRIGRSRYSMMKEKLGYVEGGSQLWIDKLHSEISSMGGKVLTSSRITKVTKCEAGYTVNFLQGSENKSDCFDAVISTIPLPYVAGIFSDVLTDEQRKIFSDKINIGCCCVIVKLKKALTDCFWCNINDQDMDIPGVIEFTNLNPLDGNEHIVYVPYYVPTDNPVYSCSDDEIRTKLMAYFKTINPKLQDDDFVDFAVSRYTFAQPICEPEYLKHLPQRKLADTLYIADTSYYYPEDRGISESIGFGRKMARELAGNLK